MGPAPQSQALLCVQGPQQISGVPPRASNADPPPETFLSVSYVAAKSPNPALHLRGAAG